MLAFTLLISHGVVNFTLMSKRAYASSQTKNLSLLLLLLLQEILHDFFVSWEMHSLPLERAKLVMFLCMTHWPWVWLWTYRDSIQNKWQNPQSKLFACVWLCNWSCIYWEEACDSFLSFRSFMYNQWRKMFLCSDDFDTSSVRPTITSSELILTVAVSWQPITDILQVESNKKNSVWVCICVVKASIHVNRELNCKNRWKTLQLNVLREVVFNSLKKALAIHFLCLIYTSDGDGSMKSHTNPDGTEENNSSVLFCSISIFIQGLYWTSCCRLSLCFHVNQALIFEVRISLSKKLIWTWLVKMSNCFCCIFAISNYALYNFSSPRTTLKSLSHRVNRGTLCGYCFPQLIKICLAKIRLPRSLEARYVTSRQYCIYTAPLA